MGIPLKVNMLLYITLGKERRMRYFILLFIFLHTLLYANTETNETDPYKNIEYYTLENGLQVYQLHDPKAENTQIKLTVNVGYDIEDKTNYGLAHLVEHMVFRDQRIPYHDYLDYIKEEGGTYVNGYTTRYETGYLATIKSEKSYWIVETFATMLFDKNVTEEDIRVEKGALQTEIGESHWYYKPLWAMKTFFETITAPKEKFYLNHYGIPKEKERPAHYYAQDNNKNFTLPQLMEHYKTYYYPANMKLVIVGDFNPSKMKSMIQENFGKVTRKGTKTVKDPKYTATLNHKPYRRFYEGGSFNGAYIGSKYIEDDYKRYLILGAYNENLAERLQQKMRNQDGKTYSVNASHFSKGKAAVATIYFDALHDEFEPNLKTVQNILQNDINNIDNKTIQKALQSYNKEYYIAIEHDNESLMGLIETAQYIREDFNITQQSSYEVFKSITPEMFKQVLKEVYTPDNSYAIIYRDYYFFPMEMGALSILVFILFIFVYIKMHRFLLQKRGLLYTHRDVLLQRRVSSRFIGFMLFVITYILAGILSDWLEYLFSKFVLGDPYYVLGIDVPYSYIATILDPFIYLFLFFVLYYYLWRYYARIEVIEKGIVPIGNRVAFIKKEDIKSLQVVAWKERKYKQTIGTAIRFWYDVVKVELHSGEPWYIRASEANHLKEDLEKSLFNKV